MFSWDISEVIHSLELILGDIGTLCGHMGYKIVEKLEHKSCQSEFEDP